MGEDAGEGWVVGESGVGVNVNIEEVLCGFVEVRFP